MALSIKVTCIGEHHELLIRSYDGDPEHLEVELANHDREYDTAFAAMGGDWPECYESQKIFWKGLTAVFRDDAVAPMLFDAIKHQGVAALEISEYDFAECIIDYIDWRMTVYDPDTLRSEDFVKMFADRAIEGTVGSDAFQNGLIRLSRTAYDSELWECFDIFSALSRKPLIRIEGIENKSEQEDGPGHSIRTVDIKVYIGEKDVDYWTLIINGWFCDYAPMEWCTKKSDDSGMAYHLTESFLETAGIDVEEFENKYAPKEPKLPDYHYGRYEPGYDWAILHNDYVWGLFNNEADAYATYDAMVDSSDFIKVGVGINLALVHRTGKPSEYYQGDPEDYDPDDPIYWDAIALEMI